MALGWRGQYLRYKEVFLNIMALYRQRADLRMFLEIVLSLATVSIFAIFALRPTALTIINLTKEIKGKEETVAQLDQKIKNLDLASSVFSQNQSIIPDIESAVPTLPQPEVFVGQIQGIANKEGAQVLGISVGEVTLIGKESERKKTSEFKPFPSGAKEMTISVSLTGPYQNLATVVKDIENLRLPIRVDILGISSSETESGRTIVAVISGRTPFLGNE